ncbi:MAG: DUF4034 domain-containing protein [Nitrospira sp.]|nr:DUF4034 domain-containing protein [Nitrospira sp.]
MNANTRLCAFPIALILSGVFMLALPESPVNAVEPSTEGGTATLTSAQGKPLLALFKAGNYSALESALRDIQAKFDAGMLTEIELRNVYRQFLDIDQQDLSRIEEWKRAVPDSYAAHLIPGVYFKRKGWEIRGDHAISRTPPENIERMRQYHQLATNELMASLKLTKKPFLSLFHLLNTSPSREQALELVAVANQLLPGNTLARNRYMIGLTPRWGGSYEEMKLFISRSKEEGLNNDGLLQLEAIMYDDMAHTYFQQGDRQNAAKCLDRATELAQQVKRKEFREEFLSFLIRHVRTSWKHRSIVSAQRSYPLW